ncbi:MAG: DUF58 domain-containing protein [Actinomycetota bacterium]
MRRAPAGGVVGLGLFTIASGRLFGLIELYVIGVGLVLGVLAAAIHVRTRVVHVQVRRNVEPTEPMAGTELDVTLELNPLRRTPTCDLVDSIDDLGRVGLTLAPLARHRTARIRYRVPTEHRGILTLGPAHVEVTDPLGMIRRRRQVGNTTEVVVNPRWTCLDLPDPRTCDGDLIDFIRRLIDRMAVNLEFRSLREYVTGDDLRRINWKASARRDQLTLNEYEARAPIVVHVLLDRERDAFTDAGFERAVSVAASFVGSAEIVHRDTEPRLHLGVPPHFDTLIDGSTRRDAMRCLARVATDHVAATTRRLNDPGEFRVNVIICGDRDRLWLESADLSMGSGHVTVVIACEPATKEAFDHDHWFALPCLDFGSFADHWSTLSRRKARP